MAQIDLIKKEEGKLESHASKEKRPAPLTISKVHSDNHKWKQCKVAGKNVSIRSYASSCAYGQKFYLYGGYQILHGSLSDFYSISLDQSQKSFVWEQIKNQGQAPGSRSKHALVSSSKKIYLIGGLSTTGQATNHIFEFNPQTSQWKQIVPQGAKLPALESFGAVTVGPAQQQKIIVVFGFNQEIASPSNAIYQYDTATNKMSILFEGRPQGKDVPKARVGSAVATDGKDIFIFGGKDQADRLNDIWSYSLSEHKFTKLKDQGQVPAVRNGHTMSYHDGRLFVFGGIHDITWELDDLHIYNLKTQTWATLEHDSPRKIQKNHSPKAQDKKQENHSAKKKSWYDSNHHNKHLTNKSGATQHHPNVSTAFHDGSQSPGNMLSEQRKKQFYHKKAEMLSNFEVTKEQKSKLVTLQMSSQAMKNTLDVIGNPDPKLKPTDKLTDFGKESVSKFLEPLQNRTSIVIGKKPCARDGHCAVMMDNFLVIFGGDRHQMSFNDIYKLDMQMATKSLPS